MNPLAPESWSNDDIKRHCKAIPHHVTLCPDGDISADIEAFVFDDDPSPVLDDCDFSVLAPLAIETGKLAVIGWPDEVKLSVQVRNGDYVVHFRGYQTERCDAREDYYRVAAYPKKISGIILEMDRNP